MEKYMETMSRFLDLQKEMTLAMTRRNRQNAPADQPARGTPWPMVDRMNVTDAGSRLRIERRVRLDHDVFLLDHPFGGDVTETDSRLSPLIVTPLTLNMEMMTEAAALLFPGRTPVAIRNVRAGRWIVVDEETGVPLAAEARKKSDDEAVVQLYDLSGGQASSAEAVVALAAGYPENTPVEPIPAGLDAPEAIERAWQMYAQKLMTHGRCFQVIAGLTRTDQNEILAALRVPEENDLYAGFGRRAFLINPLLMDACAQMTGYWAQQALSEKFITFPAGVGEIQFFSPSPRSGQQPWCHLRIRDISEHFVRSDLVICHDDGRVWAKVTGWTHRRFDLPDELYRFWRFPGQQMVSRISPGLEAEGDIIDCTAPYYDQLNHTIWQKAIGYLYLNADERRTFREKLRQNGRATGWLSGQIAAKDAVRLFLRRHCARAVAPADIALSGNGNGGLIARSRLLPGLEHQIVLSVSHSDKHVSVRVRPAGQTKTQEVG